MSTDSTPQLARPQRMTPAKFLSEAAHSSDAEILVWGIEESIRSRHAASTRAAYDYWLGRLERWMEHPHSRFRLRELPAVPLESLWPIGRDSERLIVMWLTDLNLGPADPAEFDHWAETTGPLAPATLGGIVAAIRARSGDFQDVQWAPSTWATNALTGLRRRLREIYGPDRQAEPLLAEHVAMIAQHLYDIDSPEAARDRLLLELHGAAIDGGGASRLRLDSLRAERPELIATNTAANFELYAKTGSVAALALVVPGQNRRGGNRDPDAFLMMSEHPSLAAALERYLRWRRDVDGGDELILLGPNRSHHIRKTLGRLAEISGVEWRPARNSWATPGEIRVMRSVVDAGIDWSGQLRRRRDLVMLLVGYMCALRRSELCALRISDIRIERGHALVRIRKSKSDQEQRGVTLSISSVDGVAAHLDTVGLLSAWIAMLREHGASGDAPLFPALNRHGDVLTSRSQPGEYSALDPQSFSERLRELASDAQVFGDDDTGCYDDVSGHSLRRGFVTSAILAGHDAVVVAKHTRHKNVEMIATYADTLRLREGTNWTAAFYGTADGSALTDLAGVAAA